MEFNHFFFIFCLLIINISYINAFLENAYCEPLDTTSPCAPYLNYDSIYVNATLNQLTMKDNITQVFGMLDSIPSIFNQCKANATTIFCLTTFQKCNNITSVDIPIPSRPCHSACENVLDSCPEVIIKMAYPDGYSCDLNDTLYNLPIFPESNTYYNLTDYGGTDNQAVECVDGSSKQIEFSCPAPLLELPFETINGGNYYPVYLNCCLPCPVQVYSDYQQRAKYLTEIICFSFSTFMSVFLIITFGILPNKTNHRWLIIVFICITNLSLCASYAIQEANLYYKTHRTDWRCTDDPGRYKDYTDSTCQLMGFFFNVGGLGTIMFLTLYSFDFFLTMNMKKNKYFIHSTIGMWLFILFMSLLPMKQFTSSIVSSGCWIGSGSDMFYQYFCFYVPAYFSTFLMVIFNSNSAYRVFKMTLLFKSLGDKRILILNLRSIVFLFLILFCVVFTSFYPLYTTYNDDQYIEAIAVWVTCIVSGGGDSCGHIQFKGYGLRYLNFFTMAIIGVLLFFFTIDPLVLQIFKESIKLKKFLNIFGIQWGGLLPVPNSNTNTTSDSSGSNNNNNQQNRKSTRKSRGLSLSAKKSLSSSESSNSVEMNGLNESQNRSLDSSTTTITAASNNNNNSEV